MTKITDTIIGASGIGGIELIQNIDMVDVSQGSGLVSTIMQVVIGIVTLIGLLRKKRV